MALSRAISALAVLSMLAPNFSVLAGAPDEPAERPVLVKGTDSVRSRASAPGTSELDSVRAPESQHPEPRLGNRPEEPHQAARPAALITPTPTPEPGELLLPDTIPSGEALGPQMLQAFGAQPLSAEAGSDPQDRQIASGTADQTYPSLAYSPEDGRYLVVWVDDDAGGSLRARLLSAAGNPVGDEITVAAAVVGLPFRPELEYNATDGSYMLLWSEPNGGVSSETYCNGSCVTAERPTYDLYALQLAADGNPAGAGPTTLTTTLTFWDERLSYALAYNTAADEFLAVWEQPRGDIGGGFVRPHRLKGQRLDPAANPIGSTADMVIGITSSLSLAYSSVSDEYFVTWDNQIVGITGYELYGQRFDPTSLAAQGAVINISISTVGFQMFARTGYAEPVDAYYVTYESSYPAVPYVPRVIGRTIQAGTGDFVGFARTVFDTEGGTYVSDVAYSPLEGVWQIVGTDFSTQLLTRYASPAGDVLTDVFAHTQLSVAWRGQAQLTPRSEGSERHRRWLATWNTDGDIFVRFSANVQIPELTCLTSAGGACEMQAINQTQDNVGEPINTRTGAYDYSVQDLSIPTSAGPLAFLRSYASLDIDTQAQPLGFGWTHNHLARLIFPADPEGEPGVVLFQADSANRAEFIDNEDGTFIPAPGVCGTLTTNGDTYTVTDDAQRSHTFDDQGRMLSRQDAQGNAWSYSYDLDGRLSAIEDDSGQRSLEFDYDTEGNLQLVDDHTGRSVSFTYDLNGDLVSATDVLGQIWTYLYDAEHRLTEVIDPRGVTVERTEYDAEGRAVRQYDGLDVLVVEITYNADGTTTVVDGRGNGETQAYDYRKTLTGQTDAAGGASSRQYDLNFRPTTITDEDGDATQLAWSADGANLTQVIDAESGQTDLIYDELNNLTDVTDPRGFLSSYTYDGTLLTSSTDALDNTTTYTYTPEGFLQSVTDPRGNTTSYTYDEYGQRTSMTDARLNTWAYDYDDLGRLVDTIDPFGRVTHNEYDSAGRLIRVTRNYDSAEPQNADNEVNIVTEYAYDEAGNQISVADTYGRTTTYEYDDANRLIRTIDPIGNETTNEYDEAGNLIASTDALGRTTSYTYDELNRLVIITDPQGNETTTDYNSDGTVASTTDALGRTTTYQYDDLKRVIMVTDPLGNETSTTYDEAGNVGSTTDALGRITAFEYDALNRLILQTDSLGGETEHFYDEAGNRTRTIDPRGNSTWFIYDELNRLITVTDALDNDTHYAYDDVGNRVAVTDANGNTTSFTYDALDRLIETEDPLGNITETIYDALGNVVERIDANFHSTTFAYDDLNRLSVQWDAHGEGTEFLYDPVGNQVEVIDARGHSAFTEYDALNRPIYVTDANGNTTTTLYDEVGNVTATVDPLGNYTYIDNDDLNRLLSVTDPLGNTVEYGYDAVGNRTSMTDANGVVNRYEYDDLNRLSAVVENYLPAQSPDHETNVRTEYSYDANGNRLTITDGNGHVTEFSYDALNRLVVEIDSIGNVTEYYYDDVGNRTGLADAENFVTHYFYDDANRVTGINYPAPDEDVTFGYDAAGNRTFMDDGVGTTTWVYDELNRVVEVTDPFDGTVGYEYDAVGSRTLLAYPDGRQVNYAYDPGSRLEVVTDWDLQDTTYTYDAVGRLLTASLPNGVVSSYDYDDAGQLLSIFHEVGETVLSSFEYTYDPNGNRTQVQEYYQTPGAGPTVVVTVADERGDPIQGIPVYVFDGTAYTGFNETTDENGQVSITLPAGNYRFRADVDGVQFWSGDENHCEIAGCTSVLMTIPDPVLVVVQDTGGTPKEGLPIYVFDGVTHTGRSGTTDANGEVTLRLVEGDYRFRADFNGTQFWSDTANHCPVPGCTLAEVTVTIPVAVTVEDSLGMPQEGLPVYVFDGATYTGFNGTSNAEGQLTFTLPAGDYRFRADSGGTQFWSGTTDHCAIPGCLDATVVVTVPVTVTVEDTDGTPKASLPVYVFDGATYTGFNGTTNASGQLNFTLPEGSYRFRSDFNGTQFWSGGANHCAVPGCSAATVVVTLPVTVTVQDTDGAPKAGLPVYAFSGGVYTGYNKTTDANGQTVFTLPQGDYRFRADFNGTQFWSGTTDHCAIPDCTEAGVTVTIPVTVTVQDWGGAPLGLVPVYAFSGGVYTGYNKTTNASGQAIFTLPQGAYRFRADYQGAQYWSGAGDHCTIPGCLEVTVVAGVAPTATPTPTATDTLEPTTTPTLTDTPQPTPTETTTPEGTIELPPTIAAPTDTPTPEPTATDTPTPEPTATEVGFLGGAARMAMLRRAPAYAPLLDPAAVVVTVLDIDATPQEGLPVYAFDGVSYTGINGTTNASGQVTLTLPDGSYRFRADLNGTQFWSAEANHCTVPGCTEAGITVPIPVTVIVEDTDGLPKEGLPVYAFSGGVYTGYNKITDGSGQAVFTLPLGDYRFRSDLNGTQFWSGTTDHCTLPGCLTATVVVTQSLTVTVADTDAVLQEGLPVYVFDGADYTGFNGVTNSYGEVEFTLPLGDYRFRADRNGTHFWSGETDDCGIPGCTEAGITVTIHLTVTVQSQTGTAYPDLPVYAFDGDSYTGFNAVSDANGQVIFTLPEGDYRFRADYDGVQFWSGLVNHCTIPGCLEALVEIPGGVGGPVSVMIDYTYDPLQRLTAADYSTGEFFHYGYDAVGNRLTQDTLAGTNVYDYDIANRLIEVDGVPYTWDDKGNLLDDGLREYAYDHANRLISVEMGGDSFEFEYPGLGDRLRQTVNGDPIDYTLDLAAGLTQVLSDGDNVYLYGVGRIGEQQPEGWQFHLGDALRSARQLTDAEGVVTLASRYAPYGDTLSSTGSGYTVYQFTGEVRDASGLTHLRARYLDTGSGRFTRPDLLGGNARLPGSFNRYPYAMGNPINLTDPSGRRPALPEDLLDAPDTSNYDPWAHPRNISWSPAVNVNLASGIPSNTREAQYSVYELGPDGRPIYSEAVGGYVTTAEWGSNLCGQVALSMILETALGEKYTLISIIKAFNETESTTNWGEIALAFEEVFPQYQGWHLRAYHASYSASFSPDTPTRVAPSEKEVYLGGSWWRGPGGVDQLSAKMKNMIAAGHYVIALASLSPTRQILVPGTASGHWIVVTGFSREWQNSVGSQWNWVRINNPFNNREEYYYWPDFQSSMNSASGNYQVLEIWKAAPPISVRPD